MVKFSVHHQQNHQSPKPSKTLKKKKPSSPLKITYISSPVTVKVATASEFRAIVQELTGKDSDVGDDVGPREIRAGGPLRPIAVRHSNYGSSVEVEEEADRFLGSYEDMEVCLWKDWSDGFMGLISPLYG